MSPTRGDTTLSRLLTGVFRPLLGIPPRLPWIRTREVRKQSELTSQRQETQLGVLGTPSVTLYTSYSYRETSPRLEPVRPRPVTSYRNPQPPLRHPASRYVILRHATSYKPRVPSHRKPSISVWAPVSPPTYPRPVMPPRRSWSR